VLCGTEEFPVHCTRLTLPKWHDSHRRRPPPEPAVGRHLRRPRGRGHSEPSGYEPERLGIYRDLSAPGACTWSTGFAVIPHNCAWQVGPVSTTWPESCCACGQAAHINGKTGSSSPRSRRRSPRTTAYPKPCCWSVPTRPW